ncbi:MAG: hypothetical protein HY289_02685 [Planctomycetes bacterium]|nr:hypothetical protein [Planctomycetota bacterium]
MIFRLGCVGRILSMFAVAMLAAQGIAAAQPRPLAVWDTGKPSAEPLTPDAIGPKAGWTPVADETAAFQGDAVIANSRILAVARKNAAGLELYSLGAGKPIFRARLATGANIERVTLAENGKAAVALEIATKAGISRFRLKKGDLFVEAQSVSGVTMLRVECPSRFAVLPDFFADDILFDPRKVPLDRVELPSENFLLHFTGKQDAIVMGVFENRNQDVRVTLAGKGNERAITGSEIEFGKKGSKIWVAILEGPGMWHSLDVAPADAKKIMPLDWKMPYVAQWRVDFTRKDGLTDSWDMLLPDKETGGYLKPSWLAQDGSISAATKTKSGEIDRDAYRPGGPASDRLGPERKRWTTVLGQVQYPCWSDADGRGFLQPLLHKKLTFDGPVLIYPITRLAQTPIQAYTPVDIVRNTLGVGPCQHLLDVEGQKQEHVGRATCHVRTLLNEVYGAGQQKTKRKEIESYLGDAHDFVTHIRKRIQAYVAFGKDLRQYLAEQRAKHPELKDRLDELATLAREIDERVEPRMAAILKHPTLKEIVEQVSARKEDPTPPALAAQLNRNFIGKGLAGYAEPDWRERIKKEYTDPMTTIGGQQDEMVGECRWVVKALRQKAGILMATNPRLAPIAAEIRTRSQKMLRGGAAYEGGRH